MIQKNKNTVLKIISVELKKEIKRISRIFNGTIMTLWFLITLFLEMTGRFIFDRMKNDTFETVFWMVLFVLLIYFVFILVM